MIGLQQESGDHLLRRLLVRALCALSAGRARQLLCSDLESIWHAIPDSNDDFVNF